ncbi:hypothetical protein CBP35_06870 [Acidovorax carolinensis]|nr:hypothetical protein CBP35_06870 [Acidovorax carolinensis]
MFCLLSGDRHARPDSLIFSLRQAACLALLTPLIALAQGRDTVRDAANPDAPGARWFTPG